VRAATSDGLLFISSLGLTTQLTAEQRVLSRRRAHASLTRGRGNSASRATAVMATVVARITSMATRPAVA